MGASVIGSVRPKAKPVGASLISTPPKAALTRYYLSGLIKQRISQAQRIQLVVEALRVAWVRENYLLQRRRILQKQRCRCLPVTSLNMFPNSTEDFS
jgi:hypothetical protein